MPNPKPKNGKPTNSAGKPFQKGQSGNPAGSSAIARELGHIKKINQTEVVDLLCRFAKMPTHEIAAFGKDQTNKGLDMIVATIFIKAINTGDHTRLGFILDRIIGKVKEAVEHSFVGNLNSAIVDKIAEIEKANAIGGQLNGKTSEKNGSEKSGSKEIGSSTKEIISTKEEIDSEESF